MQDKYLSSNDVAECISNLVARNKLWSNKLVKLYFIVNSKAGCFTNYRVSKQYYKLFFDKNNEISALEKYAYNVSYEIFQTERQNHATELTQNAIASIENNNDSNTEYIVVSCGGDGTSLEVQTALYNEYLRLKEKDSHIMDHVCVLRLPLGTGNDGTDGNFIKDTFSLLEKSLTFSDSKVLVATTNGHPAQDTIKHANKFLSRFCTFQPNSPWYSFNIASVGLDAFVNFVTNTVKSRFPGNLYHLCIPLSGLFYSRIFEWGNPTIKMYKNREDTEPSDEFNEQFTIAVMGTSGHRTYGGGHKVLPTNHNVCIAKRISVPRLIRDNGSFARGTHVGTDIGNMFNAEKLVLNYDKPIMLQCDGECYILCKEHFPLTIEKHNTGFRVLKALN